jgi:hypothetical protein
MTPSRLALILLSLIVIAGCTNDPVSPERPFAVTISDLPTIGPNAHYELWFSYPEAAANQKGPRPDHSDAHYFSVGRFNVDASGNPVGINGGAARFAIPTGFNAQLIADAIVTVERMNDGHTEPGPRVLGGLISGTERKASGVLTPEDGEALGGRIIVDSVGYFILSAPTSDQAADGISGIWFADILFNNAQQRFDTVAGLKLAPQPLNPDNPEWTYEAWLVKYQGSAVPEYISLGRFGRPNVPDSTGAGPGAGSAPTRIHRTPGEDFVSGTRRSLNDGTYGVAVSVEPSGMRLARPLVTVLKTDTIPSGVAANIRLTMFPPEKAPELQFELDR